MVCDDEYNSTNGYTKEGANADEMEWNEKVKGVIWLQEKDK